MKLGKIAKITLLSIAGLVALVIVSALILINTSWFRNYVREKIIAVTEEATGGRVEIGSFRFDWLRGVTIQKFIIHGTEPAGGPPLLEAKQIQLRLKLLAGFRSVLDLQSLAVNEPRANIIVNPDGSTNIPAPKIKKPSDTSGLETIVDLAIRKFDLTDGVILFGDQTIPLSAKGENFTAQLFYNLLKPSYQGRISMNPLLITHTGKDPLPVSLTIPVVLEKDRIEVTDAKVGTPESQLVLSGIVEHLVDPRGSATINGHLSLPEANRFASLRISPQAGKRLPGTLDLEAKAEFANKSIMIPHARATLGKSNLEASGTPENVDFKTNLDLNQLASLFQLDMPLSGATQLNGNVKVTGPSQYLVNAKLRSDVQGPKLPYSAVVSGPVEVHANLKAPGTKGIDAQIRLAVSRGRKGIPVSGRIVGRYDGATDTVQMSNSFLTLPNSRIDLSGSTGKQLNVKVVSRNLADLQPALSKPLPVKLGKGGSVTFTGAISGAIQNPRIAGRLTAANFTVEGRSFDRFAADVKAASTGASLENGVLQRGTMQAQLAAGIGLRNWSPASRAPVQANVNIRNADLADLLALAGQTDVPVDGQLNATGKIFGTMANPQGNVVLTVANGTAYEQPFDRFDARVDLSDQLISVPSAQLLMGPSRVNLKATFRHPADSLSTGQLQAHVDTTPVQLANVKAVAKQRRGVAGRIEINGDVTGDLREVKGKPAFQLSSVNGAMNLRDLQVQGEALGDLSATAQTSGDQVRYRINSDFAKSTILVDGATQLAPEYPTTAKLSISNLPIEKVLQVAHQNSIRARGQLSATATLSGTIDQPQGSADLNLSKAVIYDEPLDQVHTKIVYLPQRIDVPELEIRAGEAQLSLQASYTHPLKDLENGQFQVHVASSNVQLAKLKAVQQQRPGIAGALRLVADAAGTVRKTSGQPEVLLSNLNLDASATGLEINRAGLGNLKLTAQTRGGDVDFRLDSDIAKSSIHGAGTAQLRGEYPVTAKLTFTNVTYAGLQPILGATASTSTEDFNAAADGSVTLSGPAKRPEALTARLEVSRLEFSGTPAGAGAKPVVIRNQGPIVAVLDKSVVRVESARLTGPSTDIQITGNAAIAGNSAMNLKVAAKANLSVLQDMRRDIYSSGAIVLDAAVSGTISDPQLNGTLRLQNASFNIADAPNGLSNANGTVVFNGKSAMIENLTAESGGGKVAINGFAGFGTNASYGLRITATRVRVRYPEGASITLSAALEWSGTARRSLVSGTVTLQRIGYSPRQDFGSMLTRSATPPQAPNAPSGPLAGVRLDIRIRTAASVSVQTSIAENLQADADLNLRGMPSNPGMVGRINIRGGDLVFFGSKYTVTQASISFFNPTRIEPILNVDLQTTAKGVDVALNVSGPVDNMKLTYHSDPPLQFAELTALLATGKAPVSDPNIIAREPAAPPQTYQQMGQSAILSQAIANPVASRLERVFGITKLKIDPSFTSGSELPQARLTLQQQITRTLTFTYTQDVSQTSAQIIRVEWAINERWSANATRDQYGRFSLDFIFKRQFR